MKTPWRMFAFEAILLGTFMISACGFGVLLEHPASPVRQSIDSGFLRRTLMGLAMGVTAVLLIYSPLGKRSGAQMNPAVTISHWRLGRMRTSDTLGYIAAQFLGGIAGVAIMAAIMRQFVSDPHVNYVATLPGAGAGAGTYRLLIAFLAEFAIAFILMSTVLCVNRIPRLAPYTGFFAAALVALYITFEAPLSGMSLNPARTFGSAVFALTFDAIWIYFTAPFAGMLTAIELQLRLRRDAHTLCGKFTHSRRVPCFLRCSCLSRES